MLGTDREINDYARGASDTPVGPVLPLIRPQKAQPADPDPQASIVGLDAAAEHLGLTRGAFIKRRQRRPIPGEIKNGNQPAWTPTQLDEWATAALSAT